MKGWAAVALKSSALAAGWCAGIMTVMLVTGSLLIPVLWGADWHAARAEWERFKSAWWGPWPNGVIPTGSPDGAGAGELTEFRSASAGLLSADVVVTGIRWSPARTAVLQYCYFARASGGAHRVIHLAEKNGAGPVRFHPIDDRHAAEAGRPTAELEGLRGRCRFVEEKA